MAAEIIVDGDITVEIEGYEEFYETVDNLIRSLDPDKIEPELTKGAKIFAKEIRARAPIGPTGNLQKSVKTKKLRRWGKHAPSIAALDRKKAPHAWLVVHGTSGVREVTPPRHVLINGKHAYIDNTGVMPPNRFFDDAFYAKKDEVLYRLDVAVSHLIEDGMKK